MSANSLLDIIIRDILGAINPSREDWSVRFRIIEELRAVLQSVESLKGATVEPYGSFVSNLFTRSGDLDISIELTNGSHISSAAKKRKQSLLRDVLKSLRRKGGLRNLQLIANARVPILKFESSYQNISCDISVNNLAGQMKSKLLFWINEIDGRYRDMVLLVKEWAKAHDINDPKSGSLNSYSLSLLIIFHLQTCVPAILPPLKEIYPGNMVDDLKGVRADAEKHIEQTCAMNIRRFTSNRFRAINQSSLSELFISFLAKFSDIGLRASEQGISLYSGQWEGIESNTVWLPKTSQLFVEDPFERPANCARTVSARQLPKIAEAFQDTYRMLTSGYQNQATLVATLVRREVSHLMVRTQPISNPTYYGGNHHTTHPQLHRAVHAPSHVQQQFQNTRVVDPHSNNVRPVKAYRQGQQTWRPRSERY